MNQDRMERILSTIDQLGAVSVRQLHNIFGFGSYRNMCLIIERLSPYLHEYRTKEKIVYLNKEGRDFIGSTKEIKKTPLMDHMLLCNDAYIYFKCPTDWKREYVIETSEMPQIEFSIQIKGLTQKKKRIIPDAVFRASNSIYLVEIDNTRAMRENKQKIERYKEMWSDIQNHFGTPIKLFIFTHSEKRKNDFRSWCHKMPCEVYTFSEIR